MNVAIFIYHDAEVLDFSGPYEVFCTASRFLAEDQRFNTLLVSEDGEAVRARGGYSVNPAYGFDDHPPIDLLIVAGGVHTAELEKTAVIEWITAVAANAELVASVCTGAFLLAEAGLLQGLNVTTHWQDIEDLRLRYPALIVHESRRWIDEGSILTSGGISAGIDMSLHIVGRLRGMPLAERTARQMEYRWNRR